MVGLDDRRWTIDDGRSVETLCTTSHIILRMIYDERWQLDFPTIGLGHRNSHKDNLL
jgi:hypothetical protein